MGEVIDIRRVHPERALGEVLRQEGNLAWQRLQRMGRTHRKLRAEDRVLLARRLYVAVEDLFAQRPGLKRGDFASRAGLGETSKEMSRLTLAPQDQDARHLRDLRADAERYMRLVTALHTALGNDLDAFLYELTLGTSLHPSQVDPVRVEGDTVLLEAVKGIAGQVAAEFELPARFLRTAHVRSQALRDGSRDMWPYHAGVADLLPERGRAEGEADPRLVLPDYAFWRPNDAPRSRNDRDGASASSWLADDAIAFLPHAHLGMYWDDGFRPDVAVAWSCEQEYGGYQLPITGRSKLDCEPRRVVVDAPGGGPSYHWKVAQPATVDYWLVLYPTSDFRSVVPLLWSASGDYAWQAVEVEVLTLATLEKLRRIPAISSEPKSLYQRLRELLVDGDEARIPLLERWRDSAPHFDLNPFLELDRANQRLASKITKLLGKEASHG